MHNGKKRKILYGINKLHVGGAERLVLLELQHIDRNRFEPWLVTLMSSSQPNLDQEALALGVPWKKLAFKGFGDIGSFWTLFSFLRKEKFDVVIANLFFTGIVLRLAAFLARVPVILMTEVNTSTEEDGKSIVMEKILARVTDKFLPVSREVLEVRSKRLGVSKNKFTLNYSAVDVQAIEKLASSEARAAYRHSLSIEENAIVVSTGGRLTEQKGQKYLVEAFAQVVEEVKDVPVKLVIFGEGHLRQELTMLVKKLELEGKVLLPGAKPLAEIVAVTDIFVLSSLWEGLSVMLIEAACAGLPIVATDVSGMREVVEDGENGFIVPPKNPDALAEKIGILARNSDMRKKFSARSKLKAKRFSIETRLHILYGVINELL
jgi:glycosyltransferase involved in cell wall biosynthesis